MKISQEQRISLFYKRDLDGRCDAIALVQLLSDQSVPSLSSFSWSKSGIMGTIRCCLVLVLIFPHAPSLHIIQILSRDRGLKFTLCNEILDLSTYTRNNSYLRFRSFQSHFHNFCHKIVQNDKISYGIRVIVDNLRINLVLW